MTLRILVALAALVGLTGCGTPHMRYANPIAEVLSAPPEGKALVNFHRPSLESSLSYSVFDGTLLAGVTKGGQRFQYVCDPGVHIFVGRSRRKLEAVSVVRAELEAGRTYDCLIDVTHSFWGGWRPRALVPITRSEGRRPLVPRWEAMEKVLTLDFTTNIAGLEARWAAENQRAVLDFDGGPKHGRLLYLTPPDARD